MNSHHDIIYNWHCDLDSLCLYIQHYEGVKQLYVSPYDMAACDVVLVSYETLSLELNYAISHEGKS